VVGDETTIFVVSDHGFGPLERTFFVNEWLCRKGFLKARRKINERAMVKLGRFFEWLYRFLGKRDLLKPVVWFLNKSIGIEKLQKIAYSYLSNARLEGRVNWGKTRAFSCIHTPHFGQIYLNKEGEMMDGCVSETEYDELLEALMEELRDLVDPRTGERVKVEAHYARDIYSGSHIREAPEIIFLLDEGRCEIDAKVGEERLFAEGSPFTGWKGTHTKSGVFIAKGPGVKSGFRVDKATVMDVTPTLLRFFGVPLQPDMDGRVLDEIFKEGLISPERMEIGLSKEMEEPQRLDESERAVIEERLKKLGYIS
jgi:predicted AlkP superfamily phosphohydrolase/phosphomutase